ncbi:MAG: RNA polymerase sigma factor [Sedimentisphaerales bacterium]|nr:RNA polymerase sigma factor [Sedimentisphaerales bacterium]
MDDRNDNDLVLASCQGDRTAYAGLVRRHYGQVFLVCLGVLGNVHDAEDVAQDAMLKGFQRIRQLRQGSQFGAWVGAIARNLSVNVLRKHKSMEPPPNTAPPSQDAGMESPHEDLRRAVARLPQALRLPLVMHYFGGHNVKAVAEKLDMSTSGVYLKLRTAIKELQQTLTAQGDTP